MPLLQNKLPEKLSDCLTVALGDMDKCYKSNKFVVDMAEYFSIKRSTAEARITAITPCSVCLAGGVIAKTINGKDLEKYDEMGPSTLHSMGFITEDDKKRLYALDKLRQGAIYAALEELGSDAQNLELDYSFEIGSPDFKQGMGYGNENEYKEFRQDLFALRDYLAKEGF